MVTLYLLDTNVIVELLRGNTVVCDKIDSVGLSSCFISEITIAELTYGALNAGNEDMCDVKIISRMFQVVPIAQTFEDYGKIRTALRKSGLMIDQFDMLIAASALHYNFVMVTHNIKHFERIPNLLIEDWQ
jgi:tRNA(fMet)-specific endonuclease VapC